MNVGDRIRTYWRFFLGWSLTIPLAALPWLWKERDARRLLLAAAIFFAAALSLQVWQNPHYAAPAAGLLYLILTLAMQKLAGWTWRGRRTGLFLVSAMPLACAVSVVGQSINSTGEPGSRWMPLALSGEPAGLSRAALLRRVEQAGPRNLVIVRYRPGHNAHDEWVYNDAEIDAAPVVWARDQGVAGNMRLLRYFENRQVWLAEPDLQPPALTPYPPSILATPERLSQAIRRESGTDRRYSCDQWNYFFTRATGLRAPGCTALGDRSASTSFERWFQWMLATR